MDFKVGQTFVDTYPPEAAEWCNGNRAYIIEVEKDGEHRQFQIVAYPELSLDEAKAAKLSEINAAADRAIAKLTATYPDREIATFDKQESEARAYTADPTSSTPFLSGLSQARGVPLDELVRRVLAKADAFTAASGFIIGRYQNLKDRLDVCKTLEDIKSIVLT